MIDHVILGVHHLDESKHFYENALRPLGVKFIDMPLTPMRVWQAINEAKGGAQ